MSAPRSATDRRRFLQAVGLLGFVGTPTYRQEEPTPVSSPQIIDEPGRYVLTGNLLQEQDGVPCIEIVADDVVLDGQGFTVDTSDEAPAVLITANNVTVENFNEPDGEPAIHLRGANNCVIKNNTIGDLEDAILLQDSDENQIQGNRIDGPDFDCIQLSNSNRNEVQDNYIDGEYGVVLGNSDGNRVLNNILHYNEVGIRVNNSQENLIQRNDVQGPLGFGITLYSSQDNTLIENDVTGGPSGIGADFHGFSIRNSPNNELRRNFARDHERTGFEIRNSDGCRLIENWARLNSVGINLVDSDDCELVQNVACDNGGEQIRVDSNSTGTVSRENSESCGPGRILEVVPFDEACTYRVSVTGSIEPASVRGREPNPDDEIDGNTVRGRLAPNSDGDAFRFTGEVEELVIIDGDCRFFVDGSETDAPHLDHTLEVVPTGESARYRVRVSGSLAPASINDREPNPDDEIDGGTVTGQISPNSDGDAYRFSGEVLEIEILEGDCRFLVDGEERGETGDGGLDHTLEVVPVGEDATYRVEVTGDLVGASINGREPNPDDVIEDGTVTGQISAGSDGDAFRFGGEIVEIAILEGDCEFLVDGDERAPDVVLDDGDSGAEEHVLEVVPDDEEDAEYRVKVTGEIEGTEFNDREPNPDDEIGDDTVYGFVSAGSDGDAYRFTGEIADLEIVDGVCRFLVDGDEVSPGQYAIRPAQ